MRQARITVAQEYFSFDRPRAALHLLLALRATLPPAPPAPPAPPSAGGALSRAAPPLAAVDPPRSTRAIRAAVRAHLELSDVLTDDTGEPQLASPTARGGAGGAHGSRRERGWFAKARWRRGWSCCV